MQMFRKPVSGAKQGDRVGVCVTQFDPKLLERGVVCTPGSLRTLYAAIMSVRKISYFKGSLATRAKFHITVGHETVMAKVTFFGLPAPPAGPEPGAEAVAPPAGPEAGAPPSFSMDREYFYQEEYGAVGGTEQWALLELERPVTCPPLCLVIGSKLDSDVHANACRLAFHGRLLHGFEDKSYGETALPRLRIYKTKHKEGQVERVSVCVCVTPPRPPPPAPSPSAGLLLGAAAPSDASHRWRHPSVPPFFLFFFLRQGPYCAFVNSHGQGEKHAQCVWDWRGGGGWGRRVCAHAWRRARRAWVAD